MNELIDNQYIETYEIVDNFFIKTISLFKIETNLNDFVKSFINIRSFPYLNTDYGEIIENYITDLDEFQKIEVIGHLQALLKSLNEAKRKAFMKLTDEQIINLTEVEESELNDKSELFNSFKGGEYGEMFVSNMLHSIGYEKILSKLSIQWGELSPTGVDAPYIDIDNKKLILCESKFWKDFKSAFKSIKKDIDDIVDNDKLDKEIDGWQKNLTKMPQNIKQWYCNHNDKVWSKDYFEKNFKIIVFGVVICNKLEFEKIKEYIKNIFGLDKQRKYQIILTAIPIEDKNKLISICEQCVKEVLDEVNNYD